MQVPFHQTCSEGQWKIACCGIYISSLTLQALRVFMHCILIPWGNIQIYSFKPPLIQILAFSQTEICHSL